MRKIIALALVLAFAPTFSIAGHNCEWRGDNYKLCPFEDCLAQGVHTHGRDYYSPHYLGDGHSYHKRCQHSDCHKMTIHSHDGRYYFPRG